MIKDFLPFRDRFGLNQLETDGKQGFTTQNGTLWTMEYFYCLSEEDQKLELDRIVEVFRKCEVLPGLLRRHPESREYDSMDNHTAALSLELLLGGPKSKWGFAKRMYEHGKNVVCTGVDTMAPYQNQNKENTDWFKWAKILYLGKVKNYWNNIHPDKFCLFGWYGRSPGMMALVKMAGRGWVWPWEALVLLIGQFLGSLSPTSNLDARKLSYVVWQALKRRNFMWSLAYKLWCFILIKKYGEEGMRKVYSRYYRWPDHPIKKHAAPYNP